MHILHLPRHDDDDVVFCVSFKRAGPHLNRMWVLSVCLYLSGWQGDNSQRALRNRMVFLSPQTTLHRTHMHTFHKSFVLVARDRCDGYRNSQCATRVGGLCPRCYFVHCNFSWWIFHRALTTWTRSRHNSRIPPPCLIGRSSICVWHSFCVLYPGSVRCGNCVWIEINRLQARARLKCSTTTGDEAQRA